MCSFIRETYGGRTEMESERVDDGYAEQIEKTQSDSANPNVPRRRRNGSTDYPSMSLRPSAPLRPPRFCLV